MLQTTTTLDQILGNHVVFYSTDYQKVSHFTCIHPARSFNALLLIKQQHRIFVHLKINLCLLSIKKCFKTTSSGHHLQFTLYIRGKIKSCCDAVQKITFWHIAFLGVGNSPYSIQCLQKLYFLQKSSSRQITHS